MNAALEALQQEIRAAEKAHTKVTRYLVHPETWLEIRQYDSREVDDANFRIFGIEIMLSSYVEKGRFVPVPPENPITVWR